MLRCSGNRRGEPNSKRVWAPSLPKPVPWGFPPWPSCPPTGGLRPTVSPSWRGRLPRGSTEGLEVQGSWMSSRASCVWGRPLWPSPCLSVTGRDFIAARSHSEVACGGELSPQPAKVREGATHTGRKPPGSFHVSAGWLCGRNPSRASLLESLAEQSPANPSSHGISLLPVPGGPGLQEARVPWAWGSGLG